MNKDLIGRIYDIQRFSVHDGPGIRTDVFLSGCPLHCLWCHNPEAIPTKYELSFIKAKCVGIERCGLCISACKQVAIHRGETVFSYIFKSDISVIAIDRDKCHLCGNCSEACKAKSLIMSGRDMTLGNVINIVNKDKAYYDNSGGGLTISGGEALLQIEFTLELLKAVKEQGINTCLDTSGFAAWKTLKRTLSYVDLYLYDIKHMDNEKHKKYTGVPNDVILQNAKNLAGAGGRLQVRFPIIPGYTEDEINLRATGEFVRALGNTVETLQILPYHRLGLTKYERLGQRNTLEDVLPPSPERMEEIKTILEEYFEPVTIH
jgi:pyruvate formate lyase activating enzyme